MNLSAESLRDLAEYMDIERRSGKTWKLLAAATNTDCAFVCANATQRKIIQKDYPTGCWLTTLSQCFDGKTLRGIRKPLIFDHLALATLLQEIAHHFDKLTEQAAIAGARCAELEKELAGKAEL